MAAITTKPHAGSREDAHVSLWDGMNELRGSWSNTNSDIKGSFSSHSFNKSVSMAYRYVPGFVLGAGIQQ